MSNILSIQHRLNGARMLWEIRAERKYRFKDCGARKIRTTSYFNRPFYMMVVSDPELKEWLGDFPLDKLTVFDVTLEGERTQWWVIKGNMFDSQSIRKAYAIGGVDNIIGLFGDLIRPVYPDKTQRTTTPSIPPQTLVFYGGKYGLSRLEVYVNRFN